jgi:hypothetical protein
MFDYLKQTKMLNFFYKSGEQEVREGSVWGVGTNGSGEDVGRGCRRVNMVQIFCTHVCKWKNEAS